MSDRTTNFIAGILLLMVFFLCLFSIKGDSLTMDEVAHLPSGYSYLIQKDMRLNPEHPPLIKDLSAIPLLFIQGINFPSDIKAWQEDVNSQWDFGFHFLYQAGNPAEKIIFWGRIPMILILILLGFYIFKWARELLGNKASLLALFLFSFSPTLLAHGKLVTTDVGAAAGVFIATYYFLKALKNPSKKNIILAGIFFGLAQLIKFSVILLVPFFGLLAIVWWLVKLGNFKKILKILVCVFIIGLILIWPVYQYHTWNYPPERQVRDTKVYLTNTPELIKNSILWMADKPIIRPYAYYLTGLSLVFHRVAGGNTTYFLGEVSNLGWKIYFPVVYAIKVPLAFHILTIISLLYAAWLVKRPFWQNTLKWIRSHFPEFSILTFIVLYWLVSITGNLNIGVRHLLPVFPLTILLVSLVIIRWLKPPCLKLKYIILFGLITWQVVTIFSLYPHFIAYFNELVGGPDNGHNYVVDSNLDWGQDLKRLKTWTDQKGIDKIYIDYFGGGQPQYYFQEKSAPWWCTRSPEEFPKGNYLAVSATLLQGGRGEKVSEFRESCDCYRWLNSYTPVARIGYSIFVYYIN